MSRDATPYGSQELRRVPVAGEVQIDRPIAGFYRFRLRAGSVIGAVRIWHGAPSDPITGEELDRSWRWQAEFLGEYLDFEEAWPACAGEPISEDLYLRYCRRLAWARQHAPKSAYAEPGRKIDLLSTDNPLPF